MGRQCQRRIHERQTMVAFEPKLSREQCAAPTRRSQVYAQAVSKLDLIAEFGTSTQGRHLFALLLGPPVTLVHTSGAGWRRFLNHSKHDASHCPLSQQRSTAGGYRLILNFAGV